MHRGTLNLFSLNALKIQVFAERLFFYALFRAVTTVWTFWVWRERFSVPSVNMCRWKAGLWMFQIKFRDDAMFVSLPRGSGRLQRGGRAWKETASAASSTSCSSSTSLSLWVFICMALIYTFHLIFQRSIKGTRQTTLRKMNVRNCSGMEVLAFS